MFKSHAVDQADTRDAVGVANSERLRDASANPVSRDAGAIDLELVEQRDQALGVCADIDRMIEGTIASPVAEKVDHHQPVSRRHERYDLSPEVTGGGEAVNENDWLAGATGTRGVVIKPRAVEIEKLTAQDDSNERALASGREDAPPPHPWLAGRTKRGAVSIETAPRLVAVS